MIKKRDRIESVIDGVVGNWTIGGMAVSVFTKDEILLEKPY